MIKKVCHMTSAHSRYDVRILFKQCKSLAMNGYDVTLIVNDDIDDEIYDNIKIVSTKFKWKNRLDRIVNSKNKIYKKALEVNADIYHFHDPDLMLVGNRLKKRNKKVIFDSHEDVPKQIEGKLWIPKAFRKIISKMYSIFEKYSVKDYDAVISVTPNIVKRFSRINCNSVMVTNYPIIDINEIGERNPSEAICFAGGISSKWNHVNIINAIDKIGGIKYILAGKGDEKYIELLRSLSAWNKVEFIGKVPYSEVKNIYSVSIAGMAINHAVQSSGEGTLGNTKLFEYMWAKLPVICSNHKLWKEIVEKYHCGICVDPNNGEELVKAIRYIMEYPEQAKNMGENGRKAIIDEYNWGTQESTMLDLYSKL